MLLSFEFFKSCDSSLSLCQACLLPGQGSSAKHLDLEGSGHLLGQLDS